MPTVFTKNRERLIKHDAVIELFNLVLDQVDDEGLPRVSTSEWAP